MSDIDFLALKKPFNPLDLDWRVSRGGLSNGKPWARVVVYLTSRAVQERLDEVCGPERWQNVFEKGPDKGVLCGISIRVGNEWVTKWDGAENTNIHAVKGGLSDSMKRAAIQWGIGRYLYNIHEGFAEFTETKHSARYSTTIAKGNKTYFHWNPPPLPAWAKPSSETITIFQRTNIEELMSGFGLTEDSVIKMLTMEKLIGIEKIKDILADDYNWTVSVIQSMGRVLEQRQSIESNRQSIKEATDIKQEAFSKWAEAQKEGYKNRKSKASLDLHHKAVGQGLKQFKGLDTSEILQEIDDVYANRLTQLGEQENGE